MTLLATLTDVPPMLDAELAALPPELSRAREDALRADLQRLNVERPGSGVCLDAYNRLNRECAVMGRSISAFRENSPDEAERFFSRTVQGPDGHFYWTGGKFFRMRDGGGRVPVRWWLDHTGRKTDHYDIVTAICGDRACINPEHIEVSRRSREVYTEAQAIGSMQVWSMRHGGKTPTADEWVFDRMKPSQKTMIAKFGSWSNACRAAGLQVNKSGGAGSRTQNRDACIAALRFLHGRLGHWPNWQEFDRAHAVLGAEGLPASRGTIRRYLGSWSKAVAAARNEP